MSIVAWPPAARAKGTGTADGDRGCTRDEGANDVRSWADFSVDERERSTVDALEDLTQHGSCRSDPANYWRV